eukprot:753073-Hanusia_phi.AAC.1
MPDPIKNYILGKSMVEISPVAKNEKKQQKELIDEVFTEQELAEYRRERIKNRANISIDEFMELSKHLKPECFDAYNSWMRVAFAMGNVAEDNNYKDEAYEVFLKYSEKSDKFKNEQECFKLFYSRNRNPENARLGLTTLLNECVDAEYNHSNNMKRRFNTNLNKIKQNKNLYDLFVQSCEKGGTQYSVATFVSEYLKSTNYQVVYDPETKCWYYCNRANIWIEEDDVSTIIEYICSSVADLYREYSREYLKKVENFQEEINQILLNTKDRDEAKRKLKVKKMGIKDTEKNGEKINKIASSIETYNYVQSIMKFLQGKHSQKCFFQDVLDSNPSLFAFNNTLFDTEMRAFRDIKPEDYIFTTTGYNYNPDRDETIRKELEQFFKDIQKTERMTNYVLDIFASQLNGCNKSQDFNIFTGRMASNGKSKMFELMEYGFGKYHIIISPETFTKQTKAANQTSEMIQTKGKRCIQINEPDSGNGSRLQTGLIKATSDKFKSRGLYMNAIEFRIQAKINFLCNDTPQLSKSDAGIERRLIVINCPITFTDDISLIERFPQDFKMIDRELGVRFAKPAYRDEFINMLIERYKNLGTTIEKPAEVIEASKNYISDNNEVLYWFNQNYKKVENTRERIDCSK